jgi:hypothetical protein
MLQELQRTNDAFLTNLAAHQAAQGNLPPPNTGNPPPPAQQPPMNGAPPSTLSKPIMQQHTPPPQTVMSPQQQHSSPPAHSSPQVVNRQTPVGRPQATKRLPGPSAVAGTPPPSAPTPVAAPANAPTPSATTASPSTPKSPKIKSTPKKQLPKQRRPSKVVATTSEQSPSGPSTSSPPVATATAPAPPVVGQKRPREEDVPSTVVQPITSTPIEAPSPAKRIKTEWEGPPSEALKLKTEAVEGIKTEEESVAFHERMQEYFIQQTSDGSGDATQALLEETFEALLKGYSDPSSSSLALNTGELQQPASPSALATFDEWIDFSSYNGNGAEEDETSSVAATPDLVSSSTNPSTNPSPESNGSDVEASSHMYTLDSKSDEWSLDHFLRLGSMKEIDGGESTYYQSNEFQYDGADGLLSSFAEPWAILHEPSTAAAS